MEITIRAYKSNTKGVVANLTLIIEDVICLKNIQVRNSVNGEFLALPSYKIGNGEWKKHILIKKEVCNEILENYIVGEEVTINTEDSIYLDALGSTGDVDFY